MTRVLLLAPLAALAFSSLAVAQEADPKEVAEERKQAELEAPKLADVLRLKPGMTIADIGAGNGGMTVVLANSLKPGHVFATDVGEAQLKTIRKYIEAEGLTNVTVLEGARESANLPDACCDAIFMRLVYHHIGAVDSFNSSLKKALKPGGRLAIIDTVSPPGSKLQPGVPANRGGHGVPIDVVISELKAAGLAHAQTMEKWPPGEKAPGFLILFEKQQ